MIIRIVITVVALALSFGGYYLWKEQQAEAKAKLMAAYKPPPVTVSTASVESISWQRVITTTGNLRAEKSVILAAQVEGVLTKVLFKSGQEVQGGEVLAKIDDVSEQSALKSALAALKLAKSDLTRKKRLLQKKLVAQADVDQLEEQLQVADAKVQGIREQIEHKTLKAPFAGTLGLKNVEEGGYVSVGDSVVSIQTLDSMRLRFFIQERHLPQIGIGKVIDFHLDSYPDTRFKASIIAQDIALSEENRSLEMEAQVENADGKLIPGMFVTVELPVGKADSVLVVPVSAVVFSLYGDAVYVVDDKDGDKVVNRRSVKVGQRRPGQVEIIEGLRKGETIVVAGQGKLREGARIKIDNSIMPSTGRG